MIPAPSVEVAGVVVVEATSDVVDPVANPVVDDPVPVSVADAESDPVAVPLSPNGGVIPVPVAVASPVPVAVAVASPVDGPVVAVESVLVRTGPVPPETPPV